MEMNSHQNVLASQAVAKVQASSAARRHEDACCASHASTASDSSCSHQRGWPLQGAAIETACARPASSAIPNGAKAANRLRPRQQTTCASVRTFSTCMVVVFGRRDLEPAHGAAFRVQDQEVQPGQRIVLAALWHMAHLVGDQAAYRVEFLLVVGGRQGDAERFANALDGGVA